MDKSLLLFKKKISGKKRMLSTNLHESSQIRKNFLPAKRNRLVKYNLLDCLFIGDAMTDYKAAKATGTDFLGVVQNGQETPFPAGTWVQEKLELQ